MAKNKAMKTQAEEESSVEGQSSKESATKAQATEDSSTPHHSVSELEQHLRLFVAEAWKILEPVAKLEWSWHLDLICEYLTLIKKNTLKEVCAQASEGIIFNVPPRTMKSLLISVFFPVWLWATDPARRFMFVSYSEKLSVQHSIFRRFVMESDWYRERWGEMFSLVKSQNAKYHYENTKRGSMFSTGMQATATGLGGDVLIFDDPLNPDQALSQAERETVNLRFDSTFRSRINNPATGVKIVIMQRLHELDLTGHILSKEVGRWLHLKLPAIAESEQNFKFPISKETKLRVPGDLLWPERLPRNFLDGQRIGMGSWAFNGQYQQEPAPLEGGIIQREWIRFYREFPVKFDFMVQSWDCTFTGSDRSDFVAGQVWARAGSKYYMLPYRIYDRLDFGPTKTAIKQCHTRFPEANAILIEDKANGPAIISELKKEISGVVPVCPDGGKLSRAQAMAPLWEAGSIELPDPEIFDVPWLDAYIHNICTFPKAAHDDDMDSTSQALIYMRSRLVDGILNFYRLQAAAPSRSTGASRSHEPADGPLLPDHPLARNVVEALSRFSQIQCSSRQYEEIRPILQQAAKMWQDPAHSARLFFVVSELHRLDRLLDWKEEDLHERNGGDSRVEQALMPAVEDRVEQSFRPGNDDGDERVEQAFRPALKDAT